MVQRNRVPAAVLEDRPSAAQLGGSPALYLLDQGSEHSVRFIGCARLPGGQGAEDRGLDERGSNHCRPWFNLTVAFGSGQGGRQ
jgi:hypothetical protein